MPDWLWRWLPLQWRSIRSHGLDYAVAGDEGSVCVYRGRWRRPFEVVASRAEMLTLAAWIRGREQSSMAAAPATWELPAEPGAEVVAVDDGHGCRWERDVPGHWRLVRQAPATQGRVWHPAGWYDVKPWRSLLADHGRLSAAPPEPEVRDA
jgi:hypothetical protein